MPGKVNPVIPEAVSQVAMLVMGHDATIAYACASGSLELNPFLPLVAACLLESLELLGRADDIFCRHCVSGLEVDEARCREHVLNSTAAATALLPAIGYERVCELARSSAETGRAIRELAIDKGWVSAAAFDELISPGAVCRLGMPDPLRVIADDRRQGANA
jgi:aspartate ammonia-lyase